MQKLNQQVLVSKLAEKFNLGLVDFKPIVHGAWSSAFKFFKDGQKFIVRVSHTRENYDRDARIYRFNSDALPIPEILEIGKLDSLHYALSSCVDGEFFEYQSEDYLQRLFPSLLEMFHYIWQLDLGDTSGYGLWDTFGKGRFQCWADCLLAVREDREDSLIHGWKKKLAKMPPGKEVFDQYFRKLEDLLIYCPDARFLVHSDLLNYNFLVKNYRPAAVLDWGCSMYGDVLYDIAWFAFYEKWYPNFGKMNLINTLIEDFVKNNPEQCHVDERLKACQIHIALDSIAYNAFIQNEEGLRQVVEHLKRKFPDD